MMTSEFKTNFYNALTLHLAAHHQGLTCTAPSLGTYVKHRHLSPSPDVIVTNPSSGAVLAIEVKGDKYGQTLPYATLPQLKAMRDALEHTDAEVVLISAADVPEPVLARLRDVKVTVARAETVDQAIVQIEAKLAALEKRKCPAGEIGNRNVGRHGL